MSQNMAFVFRGAQYYTAQNDSDAVADLADKLTEEVRKHIKCMVRSRRRLKMLLFRKRPVKTLLTRRQVRELALQSESI